MSGEEEEYFFSFAGDPPAKAVREADRPQPSSSVSGHVDSSFDFSTSPTPARGANIRHPHTLPPLAAGKIPHASLPVKVKQPTSGDMASPMGGPSASQPTALTTDVLAQHQRLFPAGQGTSLISDATEEEYANDPLIQPASIDDEPVATPAMLAQREKSKNSNVPNKSGVGRKPVELLDPEHRRFFSFPTFNEIQSVVFDTVYKSDDNVVVSAPTGSGKTTIFELAFLRAFSAIHQPGERGHTLQTSHPLVIYIAPTKALCNEKTKEWQTRLPSLPSTKQDGLICVEITGDTGNRALVHRLLSSADVVITTPEKLDSMTRGYKTKGKILNRLALVMIDEVHILRESRGATLEVVISRMKAAGDQIRFVALSATVPNIDDIARWLGAKSDPCAKTLNDEEEMALQAKGIANMAKAKVFKFGEEYRPVALERFTFGYDSGGNEWNLGHIFDREIFNILMQHAKGKPVLVFCPTRKACMTTAEQIKEDYINQQNRGGHLPWDASARAIVPFMDAKLTELSETGIAIHHAGLDYADRRAVEDGFRNGSLQVLISTSTLAVGVNLPAHTVIIKGTTGWHGPGIGFREYSDIDIQQMLGRAGRPQYDKSGVVIVMCDQTKVNKYRSMLRSETILESCLHTNLTEHLNSEIGLGTINSLESAQAWLKHSFLYIRIQQNPRHYAFAAAREKPEQKSWEEWLDHYVENALEDLEEKELVGKVQSDFGPDEVLKHTEYGTIMSSTMISFGTMCSILEIKPNASLRDLLEILAGATEYADLRIRQGESAILNKIRALPEIRYPLDVNAKTYADKVFILIQVTFGNIDLSEVVKKTELAPFSLQTSLAIFTHALRIGKAITRVALTKQYGGAAWSALQLQRIIAGKTWEDTSGVFRQIDSVGAKSIGALSEAKIFSFEDMIENWTPGQLLLHLKARQPNFGNMLMSRVRELLRLHVSIEEERLDSAPGILSRLYLRVRCRPKSGDMLFEKPAKGPGGQVIKYNVSMLFVRQDNSFITYRRTEAKKIAASDSFLIEVLLDRPCTHVKVLAGVDELAGCSTVVEYVTDLDPSLFPEVSPDDDTHEEDDAVTVEPCHHTCRKNNKACDHVCCKEGIKVSKKSKRKRKAAPHHIKLAAEAGERRKDREASETNEAAPAKANTNVDRLRTKHTPSPAPSLQGPQRLGAGRPRDEEQLFLPQSSDHIAPSSDEVIDCVNGDKGKRKRDAPVVSTFPVPKGSKTSITSEDPSKIKRRQFDEADVLPPKPRKILNDDEYETLELSDDEDQTISLLKDYGRTGGPRQLDYGSEPGHAIKSHNEITRSEDSDQGLAPVAAFKDTDHIPATAPIVRRRDTIYSSHHDVPRWTSNETQDNHDAYLRVKPDIPSQRWEDKHDHIGVYGPQKHDEVKVGDGLEAQLYHPPTQNEARIAVDRWSYPPQDLQDSNFGQDSYKYQEPYGLQGPSDDPQDAYQENIPAENHSQYADLLQEQAWNQEWYGHTDIPEEPFRKIDPGHYDDFGAEVPPDFVLQNGQNTQDDQDDEFEAMYGGYQVVDR